MLNKYKKKKDVPFYFRERLRMRDKMTSEEGRSIYAHRKITIEPVIGNIKQNIGLREFWMQGKEKVKVELNIACIAHNLKKLYGMVGGSKVVRVARAVCRDVSRSLVCGG